MHAADSDNESAFPILGAGAHRDRKQGSGQLFISLLVRKKALEPATRPLRGSARSVCLDGARRIAIDGVAANPSGS